MTNRLAGVAAAMLGAAMVWAPAQAQAQARAPAQQAAVTPATWEGEAKAFVQGLVAELSAISGNASLAAAEEQRALEAVLARNLAVRQMGGILLGGARSSATPEQLAEYNRLVPAFLAHSFASQIDDLVAQNLTLGDATTRSAREVIVTTSFVRRSNKTTVKVNWRVIKEGEKLKLVDASVNGVSKLTVQREEFSSLLRNQGFDGLLAHMRSAVA